MRLRWTLCLLSRDNQVLLLRRSKPPRAGLWNGVGGKLEPEESPLAACKREVIEETGYEPLSLSPAGIMSWDSFTDPEHGIYLFVGEAPPTEPSACDEGELRWWPIEEIERSDAVVPWVRAFLRDVLRGDDHLRHHFVFGPNGEIAGHERHPLQYAQ